MNVSVGKSFVCVINRSLMKLFRTNNIAVIDDYHFEITLPIANYLRRNLSVSFTGIIILCRKFIAHKSVCLDLL
jgi:hypothetical protein